MQIILRGIVETYVGTIENEKVLLHGIFDSMGEASLAKKVLQQNGYSDADFSIIRSKKSRTYDHLCKYKEFFRRGALIGAALGILIAAVVAYLMTRDFDPYNPPIYFSSVGLSRSGLILLAVLLGGLIGASLGSLVALSITKNKPIQNGIYLKPNSIILMVKIKQVADTVRISEIFQRAGGQETYDFNQSIWFRRDDWDNNNKLSTNAFL